MGGRFGCPKKRRVTFKKPSADEKSSTKKFSQNDSPLCVPVANQLFPLTLFVDYNMEF